MTTTTRDTERKRTIEQAKLEEMIRLATEDKDDDLVALLECFRRPIRLFDDEQ